MEILSKISLFKLNSEAAFARSNKVYEFDLVQISMMSSQ